MTDDIRPARIAAEKMWLDDREAAAERHTWWSGFWRGVCWATVFWAVVAVVLAVVIEGVA